MQPVPLPDFDQLRLLAEQDPAKLEQLRQAHIEAILNRASPETRRRLQGLQFQIDGLRQTQKHPLGACIKISCLMNDTLRKLLAQFGDDAGNTPVLTAEIKRTQNNLIAFSPRNYKHEIL